MNRIPRDSSKVNKYNCLLREKSFKESGVRYDTCQRKLQNRFQMVGIVRRRWRGQMRRSLEPMSEESSGENP